MKEKLKKILIIIAEITTVIWAIYGMWGVVTVKRITDLSDVIRNTYLGAVNNGVNLFWIPLSFYFLSAVLILYLLRKYKKN
jgi:hypothetical protein